MKNKSSLFFVIMILIPLLFSSCQKSPAEKKAEAQEWFRNARFGMFVHWGVYSVPGKGEWVMYDDKIPIAEYEKYAAQFNPVKFNADEWVQTAKNAGTKYITITAKHHDGFAMFNSKVSDYDIVDSTPYGKDPLKMLADACHKYGLKIFFYYSQLDWHNPNYFPRGQTGNYSSGRPDSGDWNKYLDYMDAQLTELCTNYGKIGGIWFDGMWDKPDADWRLQKTYALIHKLQPQALIGSNHHRVPFPGEDFQMFEKGLPGQDPFSKDGKVSRLPLETCETINSSWGYNKNDSNYKSPKDLIIYLINAASKNANFLLNVGPKPDGTIQPEFKQRLAEMGDWLKINGEAIYGTRAYPRTSHEGDNVYFTTGEKGKYVYAITDGWPGNQLILESVVPKEGSKITMLGTGENLDWNYDEQGLKINIPVSMAENKPCKYAYVFKIEADQSKQYVKPPVIKTDKQNVSIPDTIHVAITDATDGAEIRYTIDGSIPTILSELYTKPLPINKSTLIKAKAFKDGSTPSSTVSKYCSIINKKVNGVSYSYYEGNWEILPDFSKLKPLRKGRVLNFDITSIKTREDHFAVKFSGLILIPSGGDYNFYTRSDDGSKLFIDGDLVVNNDGSHGAIEKSGEIPLPAGKHQITVLYFEDYEGQSLQVMFKGEGFDKQIIPSALLFYEKK